MTARLACVGCDSIRNSGGGKWHSGEPHYVGCPTELAQLRRENSELREQRNRADGTWVRLRGRLAMYAFKSLREVYEYVNDYERSHQRTLREATLWDPSSGIVYTVLTSDPYPIPCEKIRDEP